MLDRKISLGKALSGTTDDALALERHRSGGDAGRDHEGWRPLDAALNDLVGGAGAPAAPRKAPATLTVESWPSSGSGRRETEGGATGSLHNPQHAAAGPSMGRGKIKNFKDLMRIAHKNVMAASLGSHQVLTSVGGKLPMLVGSCH